MINCSSELIIFDLLQRLITRMCIAHEKHFMPFNNRFYLDALLEIWHDKIWCQTLEVLLCLKTFNHTPTDMNQFLKMKFAEKLFSNVIFFKKFTWKNLTKNCRLKYGKIFSEKNLTETPYFRNFLQKLGFSTKKLHIPDFRPKLGIFNLNTPFLVFLPWWRYLRLICHIFGIFEIFTLNRIFRTKIPLFSWLSP